MPKSQGSEIRPAVWPLQRPVKLSVPCLLVNPYTVWREWGLGKIIFAVNLLLSSILAAGKLCPVFFPLPLYLLLAIMFSDLRLLPLLICPPMWFGSSFRKNGVLWPWQFALSSSMCFQGGLKRETPLETAYLGDLPKSSLFFSFFFFPPVFSFFLPSFSCLDRSLKCNDVLFVSLPLSGFI